MNWQQTKEALIKIDPRFNDLSDKWEYRIDLSGADLCGADLCGADLHEADLRGAKLNFGSHNLLSTILLSAAEDDIDKLKLASLISTQQQWCWDDFLALNDPLQDWALDELAKWHVEGDNAPEFIVERAARLTANKE